MLVKVWVAALGLPSRTCAPQPTQAQPSIWVAPGAVAVGLHWGGGCVTQLTLATVVGALCVCGCEVAAPGAEPATPARDSRVVG